MADLLGEDWDRPDLWSVRHGQEGGNPEANRPCPHEMIGGVVKMLPELPLDRAPSGLLDRYSTTANRYRADEVALWIGSREGRAGRTLF